jgi:hypothetical protein
MNLEVAMNSGDEVEYVHTVTTTVAAPTGNAAMDTSALTTALAATLVGDNYVLHEPG